MTPATLLLISLASAPAPLPRPVTRADLLAVRWVWTGSEPTWCRFEPSGVFASGDGLRSDLYTWKGTWSLSGDRLSIAANCYSKDEFIKIQTWLIDDAKLVWRGTDIMRIGKRFKADGSGELEDDGNARDPYFSALSWPKDYFNRPPR
jgi:hypothetical protein